MSAGYKRIVIVESDNLDINLGNNTSEDLYPQIDKWNLNSNKKWIALGKDWFDLYKENIEYVKYVN